MLKDIVSSTCTGKQGPVMSYFAAAEFSGAERQASTRGDQMVTGICVTGKDD